MVGLRILIILIMVLTVVQSAESQTVWKPTGDTIVQAESVWRPIIEQLQKAELDTLAIELKQYTISKVDFEFEIKEGTLYLFQAVLIDGQSIRWGGFFVGEAQFRFAPPIRTERDQMQRFFKSDSLAQQVEYAIIRADTELMSEMIDAGSLRAKSVGRKASKKFKDGLEVIQRPSDFADGYSILEDILFPQAEPAISVQVIEDRLEQLVYSYNPLAREEVRLYRVHSEAVGPEMICSYYQFVDESLENINGVDKERLDPLQYEIDATIDSKGELWGDVTLRGLVRDPSAQIAAFGLHDEAEITEVSLGSGEPVEWFRETRKELRSTLLGVVLPTTPEVGDTITLRFRYHGDIARNDMGLFYVSASVVWYPRIGFSYPSTYKMRFRSPAEYGLVASANLIDSSRVGDTLVTYWETPPQYDVTFNIADYETRVAHEPGLSEIEMYYNRALHDVFLRDYDDHWFESNSLPIINSLKLFTRIFGPIERNQFRVTESLYNHGQSFPGQINLPYWTFSQKDTWGEELYMQAHEVAHQWWGSTVEIESYHDQWLGEGLAEYSAMRLAKIELKEHFFYDKIRQYRDEIYASRGSLFTEGAEAGPIIQGPRTRSSKTKGDHQLVIYHKAALVIHMLRCHLTDWNTLDDSRFTNFLSNYYKKFAGRKGSTIEFKKLLEKSTGIDWTWFFDQWIYGHDLPNYKFERELRQDPSDHLWRAYCRIEQKDVPDGFTVIMPIEIKYDKDSRKYQPIVVRQPVTEFVLAFEEKPEEIRLNPFEAVLCKVEQ